MKHGTRTGILIVLLVLSVIAFWAPEVDSLSAVVWTDVSTTLQGFTHQSASTEGFSGLAWFDYNEDGFLDLFLSNGAGHRNGLMRNNGDGTFTNVSFQAGLVDLFGGSGVAAADIDNDGHVDLFVNRDGNIMVAIPPRSRLYHNNGDGTFSNITAASGIVIPSQFGQAMVVAFGDVDNDGFVDLFIGAPGNLPVQNQPGNLLFHNNGDLTFTDISAGSGLDQPMATCAAAFTDYNDDGLQDLMLANCNDTTPAPTPFSLMINEGDLTFTDIASQVGLDTTTETDPSPTGRGFWMCVGLSDYDNDQDFDLFATNTGNRYGTGQEVGFFEHNADGTFTSVETEVGIGDEAQEFGWGCSFADFDNDGFDDLMFGGNLPQRGLIGPGVGNPGYLYMNNQDKTFTRQLLPVDLSDHYTTGIATADFDNNGTVDIAVSNGAWEGEPQAKAVLLSNGGNGNRWLTVKLIGDGIASNRDAIGARVTVIVQGRMMIKEVRAGSSFISQDSPWLHFGLGSRRMADWVIVRWPSGKRTVLRRVPGNRILTLSE
ncbi:MAG: CRTAC1 family protein [Acidobacteriota bacterium]